MSACPSCGPAHELVDEDGPYARCSRCGGHLLSAAAASELLRDRLGHDVSELQELSRHFAGKRLPCTSCGQRTSPLTLRGVALDLCLACGALWLDATELERLSEGLYEEPSAPASPPVPKRVLGREARAGLPSLSGVQSSDRFATARDRLVTSERTFIGLFLVAVIAECMWIAWLVPLWPLTTALLLGVVAASGAVARPLLSWRALLFRPRSRRLLQVRGVLLPYSLRSVSAARVRAIAVEQRPKGWAAALLPRLSLRYDLVALLQDGTTLRGPSRSLLRRALAEARHLAELLGVPVENDVGSPGLLKASAKVKSADEDTD